MKLSKTELSVLCLFALFVIFVSGYFIGQRALSGSYVITTEKSVQNASSPAELPAASSQTTKININTASAVELESLPGIGQKRAEAIVAYREEHGPFRYPENIMDVPGIGASIMNDILDLITT